jgi:hypothetical protein
VIRGRLGARPGEEAPGEGPVVAQPGEADVPRIRRRGDQVNRKGLRVSDAGTFLFKAMGKRGGHPRHRMPRLGQRPRQRPIPQGNIRLPRKVVKGIDDPDSGHGVWTEDG